MKKSEVVMLVEQLKDGSREAFEALYEEYYDRLYFFVLKNVDSKEAAEDITQETFLKSIEKIDTLENPENYVTWLHSIAYNKCTDMFRSRKCDVYFDTDEELEAAMDDHSLNEPVMVPEDYAVDKDRARQLKAMIDSLKPDMKSALILYYYNDMSLADVAKTMGLTENTVKQKLFRARKKLKSKIEELGGKGVMMSAVSMNEILHRTVSPKKAAAMTARTGAALGGSVPIIAKIAGISAAAAISVGVPMSLSHADKNADISGNVRVHDSSAVSAEADTSSAVDTLTSEVIEVSLSDTSAAEDTASRADNDSSAAGTPVSGKNYAAQEASAIEVTPAVNTDVSSEPTAENQDDADIPEEKKETQPVDMTPEKLLSMTNSQLRELSNNDFEVELVPYSYTLVNGIRCKAFPNYVYIVDSRSEEGQPSGPLETFDRWHGDQKIVLDSEKVQELIVQGNEPLGDGVSVGMRYSQIKEARGKLLFYSDYSANPWINYKVWQLHFDLTDEEKALIEAKFEEIEPEYEGTTKLPVIDLTELGIDPVCDYAHIYNTHNGVRAGLIAGVFEDFDCTE